MKKISLYMMCLGALLLASCVENDYPTFSDSDAFVAFNNKTASVAENSATGYIDIPVTLSSLSGIASKVMVEVDTANTTAKNGVNYTLASDTLSFTKDAPTQYIRVKVIDNDIYTGDLKLVLNLKDNGQINLGTATTCTITITDNEHPLAFILNTYKASADSYFSNRGHFDWEVTIYKDATDVSKVWIGNLEPYFGKYGYVYPDANNLYGFVNEEKTLIRIPVGQEIGYKSVVLTCFNDPDPDAASTQYTTSGNLEIAISNGGKTLTIINAWGMTDSDGFWNLFYGGIVLTKK